MWNSKKKSNIFQICSCDNLSNRWQSLVLLVINGFDFWMQKSADYDAMAGGKREENEGHFCTGQQRYSSSQRKCIILCP